MRPPFLSNTILHMRILGLLLLLAMGLAACRDKGPKTEVVYATDPNVMKVDQRILQLSKPSSPCLWIE